MNPDLELWLAHARTPETRSRIKRLVRWRRGFLIVAVCGLSAFVLAVVAVVLASFAGIFLPGFRVIRDAPAWIGPAAIGIVLVSVLSWCVASFRLDAARYADGVESVGTITAVNMEENSDDESLPAYNVTLTAAAGRKGHIRRVVRVFERTAPQIGQAVRFRHNTNDPGDLQDALFLELVDGDLWRRGGLQ